MIRGLQEQLLAFMERHNFERVDDFRGHSVQFFTTHADLVARQAEARAAKKVAHDKQRMIQADTEWDGDDFVDQSDALARG